MCSLKKLLLSREQNALKISLITEQFTFNHKKENDINLILSL